MSGCSGGCCSSGPVCPCSAEQNPQIDTLPALITCFQSLQAGLHAEQAYYASLPSLDVAIIDAAVVLKEENGLRPDAASGLSAEQVDRLQQSLVAKVDEIGSCQSFSDLYDLVADAFEGGSKGSVVYDTALRISLFTGCLPEQIRIHEGNQRAIAALCGTVDESEYLDPTDLPQPFQQLSAAEAELCLSTCWQKICAWNGKQA